MQILASPLPQLVLPTQNLCVVCSGPVSVVPVPMPMPIIDPNIEYMDSNNYPIYDVPQQPVSYFSSTQVSTDYYVDTTVYDPVEDVVRNSLSQMVKMSANAEDFTREENDFVYRFVNPNIV